MMARGPVGCGKTTLISVIAGILKPGLRRGARIRPRLHENERARSTQLSPREHGFGSVVQLAPTLTAAENGRRAADCNGVKRRGGH